MGRKAKAEGCVTGDHASEVGHQGLVLQSIAQAAAASHRAPRQPGPKSLYAPADELPGIFRLRDDPC